MRENVGREGEAAAAAEYLRRGYRVLDRNWRCRLGELDLVLERDGLLVICEVKARRATAYGGPYEAVTAAKRRKLRALAEAYLSAVADPRRGVRFDVASVGAASPGPSVHIFEDAF